MSQAGEPAHRKPLRLWLGVIAIVLCLVRFVLPSVVPDAFLYAMGGGFLGGLAVIVWWVFFSRVPWIDRLGAIVLMAVALLAASRIVDKSVATGFQGMLFTVYSIQVMMIAFAAWATFSRLPDRARRASMVATILLASFGWALVRTGGVTGGGGADFSWRWTKTPEERLIAQSGGQASLPGASVAAKVPVERPATQPLEPVAPAPVPAAVPASTPPAPSPGAAPITALTTGKTDAEWPGFRGPARDSILANVRIKTDWSASPPVELWRRPVGPGWSSFAVSGDLVYTQEQRGEEEVVACYNAATGNPVWAHRDAARFWESMSGPGPRGTPTLHNGRVYTFGPTGIVNALDANTGAVLWSRNAGTDTKLKVPGWGFASSPLVVGDMVIVAASGKLVAYAAANGAPRWFGPPAGASYSSPQLLTLQGVPQIVMLGGAGATSVLPADGSLLWKHSWPSSSETRIMQPAVTPEGDVLISSGDGMGGTSVRRIAVNHGPAGWTTEERWTSIGLKSNFNDFVVHDGHVFGFGGGILACIDAKDGARKWKGGRYGYGQFVLLRDQDVLVVLSEEGEIALVKAAPDQFTELARFKAIEGKTWNHPVLVRDRLFVRNDNEMAAFKLALQ